MEEVKIKAANRKKENRKWVKIFDCFDSELFSKSNCHIENRKFSLKEISIQPNMGFLPHSHKNTDFIIIPTQGSLLQKNSFGHTYLARKGDIHIMSSGSGITHFEYNHSSTDELNCVVFEILPDELNRAPQCMTISLDSPVNQLENIIPVDENSGKQALVKNVKAFYGHFQKGFDLNFNPAGHINKILVYVIEGCITINGKLLKSKDTLGIYNEPNLTLRADEPSQILLFEILNPTK